ncbi:Dipeptidase 3 [Portunus trituberculatus]|uniref:Dipeptidase n=1 Tax=Portunus trituberculatus TaxID=210409 RepID=A0A5B7I282_PORTR|nr:Dipeptidase 3 [Portunus trituberculatus]
MKLITLEPLHCSDYLPASVLTPLSHRSTPRGLEDASHYPEVFAELLKDSSWSLQDLKKLAGLNLLRVMRQVEQVKELH